MMGEWSAPPTQSTVAPPVQPQVQGQGTLSGSTSSMNAPYTQPGYSGYQSQSQMYTALSPLSQAPVYQQQTYAQPTNCVSGPLRAGVTTTLLLQHPTRRIQLL